MCESLVWCTNIAQSDKVRIAPQIPSLAERGTENEPIAMQTTVTSNKPNAIATSIVPVVSSVLVDSLNLTPIAGNENAVSLSNGNPPADGNCNVVNADNPTTVTQSSITDSTSTNMPPSDLAKQMIPEQKTTRDEITSEERTLGEEKVIGEKLTEVMHPEDSIQVPDLSGPTEIAIVGNISITNDNSDPSIGRKQIGVLPNTFVDISKSPSWLQAVVPHLQRASGFNKWELLISGCLNVELLLGSELVCLFGVDKISTNVGYRSFR